MQSENSEASSMSRVELLGWINDLLKIEQLGTGAVHCQLLDVLHPDKVPVHKVNWRAKFDYEFVYNFKILQQSFTKFNIPKYIDVERLTKARYQDNFEFAQWMRRYLQANSTYLKDYDAVARRGDIELDFNFIEKASAKASTCKDSVSKGASFGAPGKPKSITAPKLAGFKNDSMCSLRSNGSGGNGGSAGNLFASLSAKDTEALADLSNMIERQKADKNPQLEILKAERDFYYSKLRDIDHMLDVRADNNMEVLISNIREILYLTPEKIAIVCENGDIKIKNKLEDDLESKENRDIEDIVVMSSNNVVKGRGGRNTGQAQRGGEIMVIEDEESGQDVLDAINNASKERRTPFALV